MTGWRKALTLAGAFAIGWGMASGEYVLWVLPGLATLALAWAEA